MVKPVTGNRRSHVEFPLERSQSKSSGITCRVKVKMDGAVTVWTRVRNVLGSNLSPCELRYSALKQAPQPSPKLRPL